MRNEVIEMVGKATGKPVYTGWRRTLMASNSID